MPTTTEDRLLEKAQLELALPNGAKRAILPLEGSYERKAIMEIALLTIKWTTENFVEFPIGTRTTYRGTTYTLHTEPKVKKVHSRLYGYDITLEAPEADLARLKFKFPADGRLQFSLTAKPQEFIRYIVDNLNERGTQGWQGITSLPADTSEKTLTFNHNTLIEALKSICEAFKTEWSAEAGVLSLGAVEFEKQSPITLAYGKGKGLLPGLVRTDNGKVAPLGRMYVQTTTRNIPESYQRKTLKLASGTWHFNGTTFTNAPTTDSTAYYTTENYVELANKAVISAEASTEISDIYPKRVGVVSQVFKLERATRKTANGKDSATSILFDFIDTTNEVDYKAHIIKGETAKLIFQSGACAGREFEFQYKHEEKRFLLVPLSTDDTIFPSETFPIAVGDKYAVFGIELPNQYITAAETEAAKAAVATLHKQAQDRISITAEVQSLWLKKQTDPTIARKLRIGGFVSFQDPALSPKPYTIRIKAIKRPLTDPEAPTLELSNEPVQTNSISTVIKDVQALKYANSVTNSIIASNAEGQSVDVAALDEKYLSAAAPDVAKGTITFAEGLKALKQASFDKGIEIGNATSGFVSGKGATIDENGSAEFETLTVRGFIKAAEYVINRIKITEGAQWLTEGGVIEKVVDTTPRGLVPFRSYDITMRERFAGDTQAPFMAGDIIRGQYNNLQGGGDVLTSWMAVRKVEGRVVSVGLYQDRQVPGGANAQPIVQMRVARWGNASDKARQSHIVLDPERGQIVRRVNVDAPIIDPGQVDGFSLGTLPTWVQNALGGAVSDKSDYLYARGIITQDIIRYTPEGKPIAERVDRGVWSAQQSYYHEEKNATTGIYEISRVWLDGTLYELAPRGNGSTQPSANNPNWIVVQEKPRNGDDGRTSYLHIKYSNDGGSNFTLPNGETVGDYIGRCTDFNKTAPTSTSAYKWSKNKGEKGDPGKNGADGLTPMPNLLKSADFDPKNVSNDSARNGGFAWRAETVNGGIVRHEPNVAAPHAGAKVVSCESFQKSTRYNDVNCIASLYQVLDLTAGVTYTFSVYVKGAGAGWMIAWPIDGTHFKISGANPVDEGQNTAEGWKRYAVTFTARSTGVTNIYLRSWCNGRNGGNGGKVYFACPKLEESYRPTPWTRAQEDFRGAAVRPLGDWDALPDGFKFQSGGVGEEFIDLVSVKSEGALLWWSCKRSHAKTKDTRPNVNAPFWELGQNLKFVATDLLLAKKAFIENLGVRNVETRNAQGEVTFKAEENGEIKAKGGVFDSIRIEGDSSFNKLKAVNKTTGYEAGEISFSQTGLELKGHAVILGSDVINYEIKDLKEISNSAWRYTRFMGGNMHVQGSFAAKHRVTAVVSSTTVTYYFGGEQTNGESETKTVFERRRNIIPANVLEDGNGMKLAIDEQIDSINSLAVDTIVVGLDRPETLKITMTRTQRVRLINVSGFDITLDLGAGGMYRVGNHNGNSVTLFGLYDLGGKGNKGIWVIH